MLSPNNSKNHEKYPPIVIKYLSYLVVNKRKLDWKQEPVLSPLVVIVYQKLHKFYK